MPIDINELPLKYQVQVLAKSGKQTAGKKQKSNAPASTAAVLNKLNGKKQNKYHNSPAMRVSPKGTAIHFQSTKEAQRYDYLLIKLRAGHIRNLRMQADFTLQEAYTDENGERVRAIRYKADFAYEKHCDIVCDGVAKTVWQLVVEDVKSHGTRTDKYKIKKKMLKSKLGIDISEI